MLADAGEKGAPRAELRGADTDAGAVANLVHLIEQIDDVETEFDALVDTCLELPRDHVEIERKPYRRSSFGARLRRRGFAARPVSSTGTSAAPAGGLLSRTAGTIGRNADERMLP